MTDLKPCPFCGDELEQDPQHLSDYDHPYNLLCELSCQRFHHLNVEAWNHRVQPTMEAVLSVEVVAALWDAVAWLLNTTNGYESLLDRTLRPAAAKFMYACSAETYLRDWCKAVELAGYKPGGEL